MTQKDDWKVQNFRGEREKHTAESGGQTENYVCEIERER